MSKLRARLTYANVMSSIAVFLALGGGAAYASHLVVRSSDIVNNEVRTSDVRDDNLSGGGLASRDVRPNTLTGSDINELSLGKVPNADKLDGLDSSAFRVRCPTGTRFQAGACIEETRRPAAGQVDANSDCVLEGRRLPTVVELLDFLPPNSVSEWTGSFWYYERWNPTENKNDQIVKGYVVGFAGYPAAAGEDRADPHPYRCVTTPTG